MGPISETFLTSEYNAQLPKNKFEAVVVVCETYLKFGTILRGRYMYWMMVYLKDVLANDDIFETTIWTNKNWLQKFAFTNSFVSKHNLIERSYGYALSRVYLSQPETSD